MKADRLARAALALVASFAAACAAAQTSDLAPLDCVITPSAEIDVSSAVPGRLDEVLVERSARVEAGQLLARLESMVETATAELARGWAEIETEIRLEQVALGREDRRLDRVAELYRRRAVALDDKDDQEAQAEVLRLRVHQARERRWLRGLELRKAQAALERRLVRSPVSGVVAVRYRSGGEYVENQPILRLARLDPLHVETIVPMAHFGEIRVGMRAEVVPEAVDPTPRSATVIVVDALGDAASGTFGVRLALANPDHRLPAGQKCVVRFFPGPAPAPETPPAPAVAPVPPEPSHDDGRGREAGPPSRLDPPADWHTPLAPAPRTVAAPPLAAPVPSCRTLGPLESRDEALAAAARLREDGARVEVREDTGMVGHGHVVVTPVLAGAPEVEALVERLERAGVRDRLVMGGNSGRLAGRVALGAYASEDPAQVRRQDLAALGFGTELMPMYRSRRQWWLDVESWPDEAGAGGAAVASPSSSCAGGLAGG